MAEQLQCKHKHKHVRRNNEGGCHETSHEIYEFRIHSTPPKIVKINNIANISNFKPDRSVLGTHIFHVRFRGYSPSLLRHLCLSLCLHL